MNRNTALVRVITTVVTALSVALATSVAVTSVATAATKQDAGPAQGDAGLVRAAITLTGQAGFARLNPAQLTTTRPITAVPLTPTLAVRLPNTSAPALTDGHIVINNKATDGTVLVTQPGSFGVVTDRHAGLEFRYPTLAPAGTTLVRAPDGGLDETTSTGSKVAHLDPATAIDSAGTRIPASYTYDQNSHELIVRADTTKATGAVFIDPSWRCWATASAYGVTWILAAAAWLFTDGTVTFLFWALRAWFGLSYGAADAVARACAVR